MRSPVAPTSAVAIDSAAEVFDRQHLASYTLGDAGLERELLQLFMAQIEQSLGNLKSASSASEWKLASHTLKGSAAAMGASQINRLAAALEGRGFTGKPSADDHDIAALEQAGQRFIDAAGRIIG